MRYFKEVWKNKKTTPSWVKKRGSWIYRVHDNGAFDYMSEGKWISDEFNHSWEATTTRTGILWKYIELNEKEVFVELL